jgi:quercetin dioxygenase-like cupin family protein
MLSPEIQSLIDDFKNTPIDTSELFTSLEEVKEVFTRPISSIEQPTCVNSVLRSVLVSHNKKKSKRIGLVRDHKKNEYAVLIDFSEAGMLVEKHSHVTQENFVVLKGEMVVHLDKSDGSSPSYSIKKGGMFSISPNTPHALYFPEETVVICASMPADISYPDGIPCVEAQLLR